MQTPEYTSAEYEAAVERDTGRNIAVFSTWEFVWGLGMPFAMYATFAPAYLSALQASKTLIGLVLTFPFLFNPAQVMVGYWVPARRRLSIYRRAVTLSILPLWFYAIASALWGAGWPHRLHVTLYVLGVASLVGVSSVGSSIYWEMMTETVTTHRRGRLFGWRTAGMGIAGLISGALAAAVLRHWPTPLNFRIGFVVGAGMFLVSCVALWHVRDHVDPLHFSEPATGQPSFLRYFRSTVQQVWKDPNYRIFLFFQVLIAIGLVGAPFMVAAARDQLGVSAGSQGIFSVVYLGSAACCGWALGLIADKYGYRLIGCIVGTLLAAAFLLCLTTHRIGLWYVAYGAYALVMTSYPMLLCNMGAELCPAIPANRLVAVGNVIMLPFVAAATILSGVMIDITGSYAPIFIANMVLSVVAVLGYAFIVREPRAGTLYMIKMTPHE